MENKKVQFHEFDPVLYPVKLWVAITDSQEIVNDRFYAFPDDKMIDVDFERVNACSIMVRNKQTRKIGSLIVFSGNEDITTKLIAHEATHSARDIWNHIGEEHTGHEADAYLVGWIAECCEIVKNFKDDTDKEVVG
jgi:hypothetical protein